MKYGLFLLCFCVMTLSTGIVSAVRYNEEFNPAEARKIKTLNVLGVNMEMGMGQIREILESQGFKVRCGYSDCLVREGNVMFSASYKKDRRDRSPLNERRSPTFISHSINGADAKNCIDMQQVIDLFCTRGTNDFPCIKSNNTILVDVLPRKHSDDGWKYSMRLKVDPPLQCKIILERLQIIK